MTEQIYSALIAILIGVSAVIIYFWGSNWILDALITRSSRANKEVIREKIRPWLFAGPALFFLTLYLVYPVFETLWLSFQNSDSTEFVGMSNYAWLFNDGQFHITLRNNLLWLIIVPTLSTVFGLAVAVLADRAKFGTIAKSIIFMPMAISFVGASVIWKFVYHYNGEGDTQIGILNAIVVAFGGEPQFWLSMEIWNSVLLMVILIWIQTGFAMVILALRFAAFLKRHWKQRSSTVPIVDNFFSESHCRKSCQRSSWFGRPSPFWCLRYLISYWP